MKRKVIRVGMRVCSIYEPDRQFLITRSVLPERIFFAKGNRSGYLKSELLPARARLTVTDAMIDKAATKALMWRSVAFYGLPAGTMAKSAPEYKRSCLFCGTEFVSNRKTAKYCPTKPCRINHWKSRNTLPVAK